MKPILTTAIALFLLSANVNAQTASASGTLLPDQNPNYQKSRDLYMENSSTYTSTEGQTVQQTYKAIDDVEAKKERKELAAQRRHERRMARINSRGNRRYYNNGYNNYSYYDGYYGYRNPYGFYSPNYYSNNIYGNPNSILNTALLGLTLWSILKH